MERRGANALRRFILGKSFIWFLIKRQSPNLKMP
ncbi:MAG: hypothetical protein ACJAU6_001918 [Alphaproteobacteria bacterium]|jgi:hypothetical protein